MTTNLTREQREIAIARLQDIADQVRAALLRLLDQISNTNPKVVYVTDSRDLDLIMEERLICEFYGIRTDN